MNERCNGPVKFPGKRQFPIESGDPERVVVVSLRRGNDDDVVGSILTLREWIVGSLEILSSISKFDVKNKRK